MVRKKQIIPRPVNIEIKSSDLNYIRVDLEIGSTFLIPRDGNYWKVDKINDSSLTLSRKVWGVDEIRGVKGDRIEKIMSWKEFWNIMGDNHERGKI